MENKVHCPTCGHQPHPPGKCLNIASDSDCNCGAPTTHTNEEIAREIVLEYFAAGSPASRAVLINLITTALTTAADDARQSTTLHEPEITMAGKSSYGIARDIVYAEDLGKTVSEETEHRLMVRITKALDAATDETWERAKAEIKGLPTVGVGAARKR